MANSEHPLRKTRIHPAMWLLAFPLGVLLAPIVAIVMALCVVAWPVLAFMSLRHRHRFLSRQRDAGRLVAWPTARERAANGTGMFLVEVQPTGLGDIWYVNSPALISGPECPLPLLSQRVYWELLENACVSQSVHEWCETHLPVLCSNASLVQITWRARRQMLKELPLPFVRAISYEWVHHLRV